MLTRRCFLKNAGLAAATGEVVPLLAPPRIHAAPAERAPGLPKPEQDAVAGIASEFMERFKNQFFAFVKENYSVFSLGIFIFFFCAISFCANYPGRNK